MEFSTGGSRPDSNLTSLEPSLEWSPGLDVIPCHVSMAYYLI